MTGTLSNPTSDPASTDLTIAIVTEIAAREDADPLDLPPLQSVIDAEALGSLFWSMAQESPTQAGSVEFAYCGYDVRVESDGEITIT